MKIDQRMISRAALLAFAAGMVLASSPPSFAAATSSVPYCVMTGGRWGPGSVPQICRFFDYQQCLEAAAALRGNCVVNIDYRGDAPMSPAPRAQRYRR